tara:strand:- start:525 stop:1115 length:591 start_codon:yes stop_codon:yes gene_type:complete
MIEIISKDDTRIQFDDREAKYSNVLKSLYDDDDENGEKKFNESIPLHYISDKQLQILKSLLQNLVYYNLNQETIKKIDNYDNIYVSIKDILKIREDFTIDNLFKFIDICNFLDIPVLIHILKMKIYTFIDSNTREDIVKMFNIDKELIDDDDSDTIENYVKETDINDIMKRYTLETGDFTKKENEAIEIFETFIGD